MPTKSIKSEKPARRAKYVEMSMSLFDYTGEIICGVDEAGRGPLAGPVFAAAVILDAQRPIAGLRDSKKLTAVTREQLAGEIKTHAVAWAIAQCSEQEIDTLNILHASMLAMRRAGARTIGQNEATSVVYGMPKVAFECGAVGRQLPLDDIAGEILAATSIARRTRS